MANINERKRGDIDTGKAVGSGVGAVDGDTMASALDPFTDNFIEVRDLGNLTAVVGSAALGNKEHVDQAVKAAHEAFLSWRETDIEERKEILAKATKLVQESSSKYIKND